MRAFDEERSQACSLSNMALFAAAVCTYHAVGCAVKQECEMGKYVLGWILGVPAIVLVVIYFFMR